VGRGGEGGDLLVGGLGELYPVPDLVEGPEEPVYAVAGVAVDPPHPPVGEALEDELSGALCHGLSRTSFSLFCLSQPAG